MCVLLLLFFLNLFWFSLSLEYATAFNKQKERKNESISVFFCSICNVSIHVGVRVIVHRWSSSDTMFVNKIKNSNDYQFANASMSTGRHRSNLARAIDDVRSAMVDKHRRHPIARSPVAKDRKHVETPNTADWLCRLE